LQAQITLETTDAIAMKKVETVSMPPSLAVAVPSGFLPGKIQAD
jgi:hypothetical protein